MYTARRIIIENKYHTATYLFSLNSIFAHNHTDIIK